MGFYPSRLQAAIEREGSGNHAESHRPAGYRYITLGVAALTLVLIINIEVLKNTGWDPFGSWASTIAILAYCIVATVVMFWSMYKSIQK